MELGKHPRNQQVMCGYKWLSGLNAPNRSEMHPCDIFRPEKGSPLFK